MTVACDVRVCASMSRTTHILLETLNRRCVRLCVCAPTAMYRTTYMFAYMDADPRRMSLESMMDDYWELLPT